jgi:2-polyprenyl-3-methyl-5-hydroxy-6-metoxy-1,4-benzoquinol methylase
VTRERAGGDPAAIEPASFRDPDSVVFYCEGEVLRALSARGRDEWRRLASTAFFPRLVEEGRVVATEEADAALAPPALRTEAYPAVLRHERIPFVSYPYEWTAGMLRDAALLQLDLLVAALDEDMTLKDATPYNVQWQGARPVFVDVGSFEALREGEPWAGYRQFCMLFLYPLLLRVYKGIPFQPWLRGSLEGVSPQVASRLLSGRDRLRRGVTTHVRLHARLERRYGERGRTAGEVRKELRAAGFGKELMRANVLRMRKLVAGLDWRPGDSAWAEYRETSTYSDEATALKDDFVRDVARSGRWDTVWDLGCNDGRYARIAAQHAGYVVALDADPEPVELVYASLRRNGPANVLPLTMNVTDPSPGLGWRGQERKAFTERGAPDLVLCLALLHHLTITANVPVRDFVGWLRSLGAAVVIEFVAREDAMAQRLLAAKRAGTHLDYDQEFFERCLAEAFAVERTQPLEPATRTLYFARPR